MNILDIVEENASKNNAVAVHEIELDVGELAGIEFDALGFAFENAEKTKMLKDVKFTVNRITPVARCSNCTHEFDTSAYYSECPRCGSVKTTIVKGNELKVRSFKMD